MRRILTALSGRRSRVAATGLFVAFCASSAAAAARPAAAGDCASLLRMTQTFSDAGQRGDGPAMAAMLDDQVIFFNEGGDRADKADMGSAKPSAAAASVKTTMTVTDWACQVHGRTAVTSFIDDQRQEVGGETTHARYRSVETWLQEAGRWLMVGSATIALHDDPPAVSLRPEQLDDYVGTYQTWTGQRFSFTRTGSDLFASTQGGTPTLQKAEVRDVFFTPGRARFRKVFQRDSQGRVTGFAVRREGHDVVFHRLPDAPGAGG